MTVGVVRATAETPWVVRRERVAIGQCVSPLLEATPPVRHERDLNLAFGTILIGFKRFCHDQPTEAGFSLSTASRRSRSPSGSPSPATPILSKRRLSIITESAASCQSPRRVSRPSCICHQHSLLTDISTTAMKRTLRVMPFSAPTFGLHNKLPDLFHETNVVSGLQLPTSWTQPLKPRQDPFRPRAIYQLTGQPRSSELACQRHAGCKRARSRSRPAHNGRRLARGLLWRGRRSVVRPRRTPRRVSVGTTRRRCLLSR